jgi:hypothetical protein
MPTYRVLIYASFSQEVEVEADSPSQASAKAEQMFDIKECECDGVEVGLVESVESN